MHTVLGAEVLSLFRRSYSEEAFTGFVPESGGVSIGEDDREKFSELLSMFDSEYVMFGDPRPFAGAPVRSGPRRTYDPAPPFRDPEGENTPMYLSNDVLRGQELLGNPEGRP